MPKQRLLWINRDADNFKSREHLPAINAHVAHWSKANSKIRYERARKLHSTVARTYFPWQRRKKGDGPSHEDVSGRLPERPKSTELDSDLVLSSPQPGHYERVPAVQAYEERFVDKYRLAPILHEGQIPLITSIFPASPSTSSLDPFFRLPRDISTREKSLLHLYFTTMPRLIYGTHVRAKYCPVRDTTAREIAENALFMQGILLDAEVFVTQAKRAVDRVSIFQRKARIYRELSKMIADPASRHSNATISVLAATPMAAARLGDFELSRKHCVALLHLLNSQGGPPALQKMVSSAGISTRIVVSFVTVGAGHALFADYIKLLASLLCLKDTLLAIQSWSRSFFLNDAILPDPVTHDNLSAEAAVSTHKLSQKVERYHNARAKAFASDSLLHRFVVPSFEVYNLIDQRCYIATLAILVVVLFDLRNEYDESTRFLDEMVLTVASGQIVDEDEPPPMRAITILYIATDCAARYESVGFNNRWNVLRSWLAVEVLELVLLASDRGRLKILELLSNSLMRGDGDEANYFVTEDELTAICDEIRLAWMRKSGMGDP